MIRWHGNYHRVKYYQVCHSQNDIELDRTLLFYSTCFDLLRSDFHWEYLVLAVAHLGNLNLQSLALCRAQAGHPDFKLIDLFLPRIQRVGSVLYDSSYVLQLYTSMYIVYGAVGVKEVTT